MMRDGESTQARVFRSGQVVIVGKPNVGKSTLFNALVGERLSIATPKPQTTRSCVLGILTTPKAQMLFLDTPGLLDPRYRLQEVMRRQIDGALEDADALLCIIDATDIDASFDRDTQDVLKKVSVPVVLALNKVDLVGGDLVDRGISTVRESTGHTQVLPVSATRGTRVLELRAMLEEALPVGPQFYPDDMLTEQPERFFVAELVREEIMLRLRQEVPYAIAVRVDEFREGGAKTYIRAVVVVERESQKGIVIGSKGKTLKAIGKAARQKIEAFLGAAVYLDLHVKVVDNWRKKESTLRDLGYTA